MRVCVLVSLLAWILRSAVRQSTLRESESCIYGALTCTAYRFVSLLLPCQSCHKNVVAGQSRLWQATLPHFTAAAEAATAAVSSQKVWRNFCAISDALNMADPAGHMEPAQAESAAHRSRRRRRRRVAREERGVPQCLRCIYRCRVSRA